MKRFLFSVALCSLGVAGFAQQDPQFTQNMFDRLSVNPGSAGTNEAICATVFYRNQWSGFAGNPVTGMINIQSPVKPIRGGLGLTLYNDKLGQETNNLVRLAYSYHLGAGPGTLGIGLSGGIVNKTLKSDWIATDGVLGDVAIPDAGVSNTTYDLAFGLYYTIPKRMYVGLSTTHITETSMENLNIDLARHYYIMAGYSYDINSEFTLKPSVFAKTDAASTQIDLNCTVLYNNMVWLGVTYRTADAIAPMIGYQTQIGENSMLKIGYSYDVTTSQIKDYSSGSHEIMLNYCFKLVPPSKVQKYKNVRFL